ncbi:MAG: methylaspartate ammonia-lyase [Acholeplasmataceae bacterium]|jgi:methylaspartate ammonia-lyase
MKIKHVVLSKSTSGFYFDDQKAIKSGKVSHDGFFYEGDPQTPGFTSIRQKGEAISIQLVLEDGTIGYGDCAAVQYSGAGGRDPLFLADENMPFIREKVVPLLIGLDVSNFRENAERFDKLNIDGKHVHTAIRYGVTQALLSATANYHKLTMAEIIRKEYNIKDDLYKPVPIFTQSGDNRYGAADQMIISKAAILPHALINNVSEKLGKNGEILAEYAKWLINRINTKKVDDDYHPVIQFDVYGTIGEAFDLDVKKMGDYIISLEKICQPYSLRIEGPVDTGEKISTMNLLRDIRKYLEKNGSKVKIVADEWCNTLEDIKMFADNKAGHILQIKTPDLGGVNNIVEAALYCNSKNIGSYIGGTCNETNISAQTTTNIAIACHAKQVLAKPGMGVDEGLMIVRNEMNRVVALANARKKW